MTILTKTNLKLHAAHYTVKIVNMMVPRFLSVVSTVSPACGNCLLNVNETEIL